MKRKVWGNKIISGVAGKSFSQHLVGLFIQNESYILPINPKTFASKKQAYADIARYSKSYTYEPVEIK